MASTAACNADGCAEGVGENLARREVGRHTAPAGDDHRGIGKLRTDGRLLRLRLRGLVSSGVSPGVAEFGSTVKTSTVSPYVVVTCA